jgi:hypothetical protein
MTMECGIQVIHHGQTRHYQLMLLGYEDSRCYEEAQLPDVITVTGLQFPLLGAWIALLRKCDYCSTYGNERKKRALNEVEQESPVNAEEI